MNPVFAAMAAVAFGLTLFAADAPAAHHPSQAHASSKAAPAGKSAKASSAGASGKSTGRAAKDSSAKGGKSAKASAKGGSRHESSHAAEPRKGKGGRAVSEARGGKGAREARGEKTVKVVRIVKGRKVVVERTVPASSREGRHSHHAERDDSARSGGIGREAFVPSSPPIPRAEALRQIQSRNALPPIPAPNVPIPPPRSAAAVTAPARPSVTLPPPAAEVARAQAPAVQPAPAMPVEAPRPAPRYSPAASELSGPEAAAAAAAALNAAARAPEPAPIPAPAPARVVPPVQAAPVPASPVTPAAAPATAAAAALAPATVQTQPGRAPKGTPRAYAMDGATFYQGGRKIRVQGLDIREPGMTSEHATQRLQRALDSGSVSVEPVEVDASGHTVAVVRVNGRNVAEAVRSSAN